MGLAQQLHLSDQPFAGGVDDILGADTHERVREPLQGRYAKVTEPGAFGSFIAKLDIVVENGHIEEERYALLEVDPDLYHEDEEMKNGRSGTGTVSGLERAAGRLDHQVRRRYGRADP